MGAPKKRTIKRAQAGPGVAAFAVVVEDMRSQFKVFGEALEGLRETLTTGFNVVHKRIDSLDERMTTGFRVLDERMTTGFRVLDGRVDGLDGRVDGLDERMTAGFAQVDRRFVEVDGDLRLLKSAVLENSRDIRGVQAAVTRIEGALETKVDRSEVVEIVEQALARR